MFLPVNEKDLDVLALEDSLKALAQVGVRKAQVVELRFFADATSTRL